MKRIANIAGFEASFPHLVAEARKGHVWCWDERGYTRKLTDEQLERIEKLESFFNGTVYALVQNSRVIGTEVVYMTSYLLFTDEIKEEIVEYGNEFSVLAQVDNHTWGISEAGTIGIASSPGGGPRRVW